MSIVKDTRMEELKRIEHLLYGANYEVWLNLYGPTDSDLGLVDALRDLISKDCEIFGVVPLSPKEAVSEIMGMVLYKGDTASGPLELESNEPEITELMNKVFSLIDIQAADIVSRQVPPRYLMVEYMEAIN